MLAKIVTISQTKKVVSKIILRAISIKWLQMGYKWVTKLCPLCQIFVHAVNNIYIDRDYGDTRRTVCKPNKITIMKS
jgi:hypothetical protein